MKIPSSFYQADDVVSLARNILGKKLCTQIGGKYTSAIITETEAYRSWGDRACHAYQNRRTPRTDVMFGPGGVSYVYLCYGIHHLFNIVTNIKGKAEAVLIRAAEPLEGIEEMEARRGLSKNMPRISSGPGNVSRALGISTTLNREPLSGPLIWLEEHLEVKPENIGISARIGVDYAGKDALHPWRFFIKDSRYVSKR